MRGLNTTIALALCVISAPAWADDMTICTDRPSKSTGPCTVPDGKWQIETGLVDWSRQRSDGVTTDMTTWGATGIKYGVSSNADVELWLTPLETMSVRGDGMHQSYSSFGDAMARIKYELTPDDAKVQVALDPFIKIPTANHDLGNGKVEGGLLVPVQATLGKNVTLSLDPEVDLLADDDGHGHHVAMSQVFNLGTSIGEKINVSAELWGQWNWDPGGTQREYSADVAFAYQPNKNLQLDCGANFGLNKQTPGIELYTGVSVRF